MNKLENVSRKYQTLSGRFDNRVHEELAEMGLERVEVNDQGLHFIGKQTDRFASETKNFSP